MISSKYTDICNMDTRKIHFKKKKKKPLFNCCREEIIKGKETHFAKSSFSSLHGTARGFLQTHHKQI